MNLGPGRKPLLDRARKMRKNPTKAERILWRHLRGKQLLDRKFRRQHILEPYIVDFYCSPEKMVVEVDGITHGSADAQRRDEKRDDFLREHYGVTILRVVDMEVIERTEFVLTEIAEHLG